MPETISLTSDKQSAFQRFRDRYKSELAISIYIPIGLYLLWVAFVLGPPLVIFNFGHSFLGFVCGLIISVLSFICGVKFITAAILQIDISRSSKTTQYVTTKTKCLRALQITRLWPKRMNYDAHFYESVLGTVHMKLGEYAEAEAIFLRMASRLEPASRVSSAQAALTRKISLGTVYCNLSYVYFGQRQLLKAAALGEKSLALYEQLNSPAYARMRMFPLLSLAMIHYESGNPDLAETELNRVFEIYGSCPELPCYGSTTTDPLLLLGSIGLALVRLKKGDEEASFSHWHRCLVKANAMLEPFPTSVMRGLNAYATLCMDCNHLDVAQQALDMSYLVALQNFDHPEAAVTLDCFERLLLATDRADEVKDMRAWLRLTHLPAAACAAPGKDKSEPGRV